MRIVELKANVFHASLIFDGDIEVSSRSSDAIALALRMGAPIKAMDTLMDEAAITVSEDEEDEVERFREFLDQVSPEDFDKLGGPEAEAGGSGMRE